MSKFTYNENLKLVPVQERKQYCRHCGEEISLSIASIHLLECRPEVHEAIEREFDRKEARALAIAAN